MDNPRQQLTAVRKYCYACGTPWNDLWMWCQVCADPEKEGYKNFDCSVQVARPVRRIPNESILYQAPWDLVPWPPQGSICIYGGPGTGKSSLSALIRPTLWLTKEQEPKPAAMMFRRLLPDGYMPEIAAVDTAEDIANILRITEKGPIVVDSLTAFGLRDSLAIAHLLVNWTRNNNDRSLGIMQANSKGEAAGYMEIPHLFDACISVKPDPWGVRCFRVEKCRWGPLDCGYFRFDPGTGQITQPSFPAAYTVEGNAGQYYLHPYPISGAKWTGLFRDLEEIEVLEAGMASAAQKAAYMPGGFIEPLDSPERQRFAERNALEWISAEEGSLLLAQHAGAEQ